VILAGEAARVSDREAFTAFVERRWPQLVRLAWALTGDRHLGEDLAQATLDRLWRRWPKVSVGGDPWPYTQRVAASLASTWRRRRWHGELATADVGEARSSGEPADPVLNRDTVGRWLAELPRRQLVVVTLRFLADLSVDETATIAGCSPGTVKSQTAKALAHLRAIAQLERSSEEQVQ
jgi:RNA polymerase sigma-70 factor (sigma-E family)